MGELTALARLQPRPSSQFLGLCLYAASTFLASCGLVLSKSLSGTGLQAPMPVLQLILLRSCMLVACTLPAARHPQARQLLAERPKLWLVRGVLGFASVAFIQQAVHLLAISDAVALALLSPIVVAVLGTLVLRERPPQLLLVALPLALSGALLLVKPGLLGALAGGGGFVGSSNGSGGGIETTTSLGPASLGVAAGLGHVLSSAGAKLSVRRLAAGSTSPHAAAMIVLSAGLVSAVGSAAICVLQQTQLVWPQHVGGWLLVAGVGVMSIGHQACMTAAMQRAPATRAAPLTYLSAVWGLLADFLVFGQPPSAASLVGGAAIVAGGLLVALGRRGASGSAPLRQLPVSADASSNGTVLLPLANNTPGDRQRQAGGGRLQAALANAWVHAWATKQQQGPALMPLKTPPPRSIHVRDENTMASVAVNAAVRMV